MEYHLDGQIMLVLEVVGYRKCKDWAIFIGIVD